MNIQYHRQENFEFGRMTIVIVICTSAVKQRRWKV